MNDSDAGILGSAKAMDIIEFGRAIHAEMSAIMDASRLGIPIRNGTLYCTTFPCHICAKHIVASGIKEVIYLEPYPKSYASDLHSDSIVVDGEECGKVRFRIFLGVSPFRYRDLFKKGRRKDANGKALRWSTVDRRPVIPVIFPEYTSAELLVTEQLVQRLDRIVNPESGEEEREQT